MRKKPLEAQIKAVLSQYYKIADGTSHVEEWTGWVKTRSLIGRARSF